MKLKSLYERPLGNQAKISKKIKKSTGVVMDPNSFTMSAGTDIAGMVDPKVFKKQSVEIAPKSHGVLWSPAGAPAPYKYRHRKFMGLSR